MFKKMMYSVVGVIGLMMLSVPVNAQEVFVYKERGGLDAAGVEVHLYAVPDSECKLFRVPDGLAVYGGYVEAYYRDDLVFKEDMCWEVDPSGEQVHVLFIDVNGDYQDEKIPVNRFEELTHN